MGKSSGALILSIVVWAFMFVSCNDKKPVPKPLCYLRTDFPDHQYSKYRVKNPMFDYQFDISNLYALRQNVGDQRYGFQEFDLGPINGTLLVYQKRFNSKDSLITLINAANDLVDEHKIKADRIDFDQLIDRDKRVFGTFFTLKGNVATNYQFYLTDSTSRFVRGEILLNCRPNYDSLRPTLDYLKVDLDRMMQSFQWKK
jgi:gliding motility-associated lipoprotein GldD